MKRMKKYILILISMFWLISIYSQTIVRMGVPPQAKEPLKVVVLFEEAVPEGGSDRAGSGLGHARAGTPPSQLVAAVPARRR